MDKAKYQTNNLELTNCVLCKTIPQHAEWYFDSTKYKEPKGMGKLIFCGLSKDFILTPNENMCYQIKKCPTCRAYYKIETYEWEGSSGNVTRYLSARLNPDENIKLLETAVQEAACEEYAKSLQKELDLLKNKSKPKQIG